MSRHVPRHARWQKRGPTEHQWGGCAVRYERGAWWAVVSYRLREPAGPDAGPVAWEPQSDRLGPYKRPRNAMIAAEGHVVMLVRRHGENIEVEGPGLKI
jgi:hypothetical protein